MSSHNSSPVGRRNFLKMVGFSGAGAGLAACTTKPTAVNPYINGTPTALPRKHEGQNDDPTPQPTHEMEHTAEPTQPGDPSAEMDAMHEAGVQVFLDGIGKDPAFWGTPLDFTLEGDVKVFEITCTELDWSIGTGTVKAMAYNGIVPGPEIRITQGEKVRVVVHNQMTQSTAVHFHGVLLPNNMDGVPFITQPAIKPGESFTYEFTAKNPGSHMYHSHHNAAEQVTRGLLGPFIIEPANSADDPEYGADYTMVLNDSGIGFTINGKGFPYTQPIVAKLGDVIRVRYMNEGLMIHPMHLHGIEQLVFSKDGWNLPQPYYADTVNIAPGERFDVIINCHTPGAWAYHCHILNHAESAHGMFGMVTALVVQE
jgi:manganese oxidase